MTETQERFLRTVLTRVPLDTVVELHLFPPIRRGTLETGVAVIATMLPPAPLAMLDDAVVDEAEPATLVLDEAAQDDDSAPHVDDALDVSETVVDGDVTVASVGGDDLVGDDDVGDVMVNDGVNDTVADDVADAIEGQVPADEGADDVSTADIAAHTPSTSATAAPRLRILTAGYRHTIKGLERGKWIVDVQEEADAPLAAVEAVLRGVRQRSTEPADPELVSHDTLAALLTPAVVAPAA